MPSTEHRVEFRLSENPWAPTAVVEELNDREGCGLELVGLAEQQGGVSSAAFVRWPDGRQSALIRTVTPLERMRQTAEVADLARTAGMPVPHHELVIELADGAVAVVQERLPGRQADHLEASLVDAAIEMNERFSGLLAGRRDVPVPDAFPTSDGGDRWSETLGVYGDRTRRVLAALGEMNGGHRMTGDDIIHTDYSFGNILFDERGRISGIIDWNFGVDRGDHRYALLGMRGHLTGDARNLVGQEVALRRLDEALAAILEPERLRLYKAHRAVHEVHESIRNRRRADRIQHDLKEAEYHLELGPDPN